jgi:hypothetical protein
VIPRMRHRASNGVNEAGGDTYARFLKTPTAFADFIDLSDTVCGIMRLTAGGLAQGGIDATAALPIESGYFLIPDYSLFFP